MLFRLRLLDTLLDLARLRAGEVALRKETFDLAASVRAALYPLQKRHASEAVTLTFEADPSVLVGESDRRALVTIVSHLVRNALAFTEKGAVQVRLTQEGASAVLTVTVTKHYVDLLSGTIQVHSKVGVGTAVETRLPLLLPTRSDGAARLALAPDLTAVRLRVGEESQA